MQPTIVSREDWLTARKALLARELEMTHALDALRAERRQLPWVSCGDGDFGYDFGVAFTAADRAVGRALYNYDKTVIRNASDMFGVSVFVKDSAQTLYHSYSTYHRGTELLMGAFNWLDLAPKGRHEGGETMSWLRLHDEYPQPG